MFERKRSGNLKAKQHELIWLPIRRDAEAEHKPEKHDANGL